MQSGVALGRQRFRFRVDSALAGLALVIAAAAALRFGTLATQSYWYDESLTVGLTKTAFGLKALGVGVHGEAEPPLYFGLAWLWARPFGHGEAGLRSLSAACGVLTVPVVYSAAKTLFNVRTAVVAGLLTALSPAMIHYSQEARAYALYVLLCAVSFLFFVRALREGRRADFAGWALASALALVAHYFALFFVLPEAVWILARASPRREGRVAVAALVVAGAAVTPLALYQRSRGGAEWISNTALATRIKDAGHFLFVGPGPGNGAAAIVAVATFAAAVLALRRGADRTRAGALLAVGVGTAFALLPIIAAFVGKDYVLDRNLLALWIPLSVLLAAGITQDGARRVGAVLGIVVCVVFAWEDVKIATTKSLQRDDWRAVAHTIGRPSSDRVIVVVPGWQASPLALYNHPLRVMGRPYRATEVVQITYRGPRPRPGPRTQAPPPAPFRRTGAATVQRMMLTWFRSPSPSFVDPPPFPQLASSDAPVAYVERPR